MPLFRLPCKGSLTLGQFFDERGRGPDSLNECIDGRVLIGGVVLLIVRGIGGPDAGKSHNPREHVVGGASSDGRIHHRCVPESFANCSDHLIVEQYYRFGASVICRICT
jgi:hypothetical protein